MKIYIYTRGEDKNAWVEVEHHYDALPVARMLLERGWVFTEGQDPLVPGAPAIVRYRKAGSEIHGTWTTHDLRSNVASIVHACKKNHWEWERKQLCINR